MTEQGAWETGVRVYALPTSFVGLALADLVQPWITWTPEQQQQQQQPDSDGDYPM